MVNTRIRLKHPESENIEYKSNWNDDYLKVISAFANTNGGELIIGVDDKKKVLGVMDAKKLLVKVFYFAGFIESWGIGTVKIVDNFLQQGLPEPDFIEEFGVMEVIFYKNKWTEKNLEKMGLNERQIKAVMHVKDKGRITNKEYQKLNKVSKPTATRDLAKLVELQIFYQQGIVGKGTFYVFNSICS